MIEIKKYPGYYWDEASGFVFSTMRGGLKSLQWKLNGKQSSYVVMHGEKFSKDAVRILIMKQGME